MSVVNRDKKIDILRSLALIGIFTAHAQPNTFLFQLRSFDVPLMVLVMGMSFYMSNKNKKVNYKEYIIKRIKRLLIPTWIFLTVFFILFFVVALILNQKYYFNLKDILFSYTLINGIGYVWIIQVFLAVAIVSPFILKISEKIDSNKKYMLILGFSYIIYVMLVNFNNFFSGNLHDLYEHFILYNVGYIIIAALGIRFKKFTDKEVKLYTTLFAIILIILMFVNNFQLTNIAKYPPTMYYISYALTISFLMNLLMNNKFIIRLLDNKLINFISKNSFWIYLWHIIPIYIIKLFNIPVISSSFISRFLFISVIAILLTLIHNWIKVLISKLYIKRNMKNI